MGVLDCDRSLNTEQPPRPGEPSDSLDLKPALRVVAEMSPVADGDTIPLLQRIQRAYGYLPRDAVLAVCEKTGLPASRVFGVATFYEQFHFTPRGKHLIRCCRGTACHVRAGSKVLDRVVKILGVGDGQTTDDLLFTLETVACLGACALAPLMVIDATYYGKMTPRRAEKILRGIMEKESQ